MIRTLQHTHQIPVFVVFGPTASGKTALAEHLFTGSGPFTGRAEIISADSMQVYTHLDIGTAKPDVNLRKALPHHLIDIRDPRDQFGAGDFVRLADEACRDIFSRGKLPVVLGGTAFYIKNFLFGLPVTPESDPAVRAYYQKRFEVEGSQKLRRELELCDPVSASRIHLHDTYRLLRALEIFATTNKPLSSYEIPEVLRPGYRFLAIGISRPRDALYARIEARVDIMFAEGLAEEFRSLISTGYGPHDPGLQAIGYKEFFITDPPGSDLDMIHDQICRNSKKYAKRQETFIRGLQGIQFYPADDISRISDTVLDWY